MSDKLSLIEGRFRVSQIIIIANFVVVSSVGIERVTVLLFVHCFDNRFQMFVLFQRNPCTLQS